MVETEREYILQWSGHAETITERFSGLLARQALVDVTLLCQEQRLRVHKLVLASCSLYFEEMLEQDLGQEPVILLKDFDFNILKAMVEFMYCGETTIAHCHLQSLLDAAQVFKVKDLESIVSSMMAAESPEPQESPADDEISRTFTDPTSPTAEIETSATIFEESSSSSSSSSAPESPNPDKSRIDPTPLPEDPQLPPETAKKSASSQEETDNHQNNLKEQIEPEPEPETDQLDIPIGIGECSRVYTHKKRKAIKSKEHDNLNLKNYKNKLLSTDCIDLSNDNNSNNTPVTLSTIDIEQDYILNNHHDSIQTNLNINNTNLIATSERYRSIYDNLDIHKFAVPNYKNLRKLKELLSVENNCSTPILRRSVRLNQLENDDSVNNNNNNNNSSDDMINCQRSSDYRRLKKLRKLSKIKSIKSKRKIKDRESISDENRKHIINSKSMKNSRKIVKKNHKLNEHKSRNSSKIKNIKIDKLRVDDEPIKFNTIASVDRSLWGDMSDLHDNCKINTKLPDYSQSKEIPFAVGLLPLRAALERMQAIPDYQPRKTRSSVAPFKGDCGVKRKNGDYEGINGINKKVGSPERSINVSDDTFCHIKIHTSSQCGGETGEIEERGFISVESTSDKR